MSRWMTGVAVGVALLILVGGCGGGDNSTTEVTKAEFTKQANAICADGQNERKAAAENYSKEVQARSSGGQGAHKVERDLAYKMLREEVVPSLEDQVGELEELGAPAAEEAKISAMLKTLSKGTGEIKEGGVRKFLEGQALRTFQEEAESYGLSCTLF